MALPSGYKRLEHIQSSGTQYVDTGFKPNQDTRLLIDCEIVTQSAAANVFGCRDAYKTNSFNTMFLKSGTGVQDEYDGQGTTKSSGFVAIGRHTIDKNKNVCNVDGTEMSYNYTAFQSSFSIFLFRLNAAGTPDTSWVPYMRLYSCQIYDNGTLVRDFIPCQTAARDIGLWDDVNGVFYGNAGTGTFTAGPEVPQAPPTPMGFTALALSDTTVKLSWSASDGAHGYTLYKAGKLIAALEDTSYVDTVEFFSGNTYSLTAYNDYGESDAAALVYYSTPDDPILYLVTDRTKADVTAENEKGTYRSGDLNRVGASVQYLSDYLQRHGISAIVSPKRDWRDLDHPTPQTMTAYLADVETLRSALKLPEETPAVPPDIEKLTWQEANDIEIILTVLDDMLRKMLSVVDADWAGGMAYTGFYFKEAGK